MNQYRSIFREIEGVIEEVHGVRPDLTTHFEEWAASKAKFYALFQNQLTISIPIDPSTVSVRNVTTQIVMEAFRRNSLDVHPIAAGFFEMLHPIEMMKNALLVEITLLGQVFAKGTKISSIVPKLFPPHLQEKANWVYSTIIQDIRRPPKYRLYLSIDPRDYLTMSENNYGWTTCMSVKGGYSKGVLGAMLDESTVVAYVAGESPVLLHKVGIEWYNKAWRQLVHVNPDYKAFVQNHGYPMEAPKQEEQVRDFVASVLGMEKGAFVTSHDECSVALATEFCGGMYLDIDDGSYGCITLPEGSPILHEMITIGTTVPCLLCDDTDSPTLICKYCASGEQAEEEPF